MLTSRRQSQYWEYWFAGTPLCSFAALKSGIVGAFSAQLSKPDFD